MGNNSNQFIEKILIPPVIAFICLFMIVIFHINYPQYNIIKYPYNLIGINIALIGFYIMGRANRLYTKNGTTITFKKSTFLIVTGIYRKTRNPLYKGIFLMLLGISVCFRNMLSIVVSFLFIFLMMLIFIPKEETMLEEIYGEEYLDYKKRTRRVF